VIAKEDKLLKEQLYDQAVNSEANALSTLNTKISILNAAQSAVDGQTVTVSNSLTNKNNAKDSLDLANINLQTAQSNMQSSGGSGLQYTVYNLARVWPSIAVPDSVICSGRSELKLNAASSLWQ